MVDTKPAGSAAARKQRSKAKKTSPAQSPAAEPTKAVDPPEPDSTWQPTPQAKQQATKLRGIAAGLWILAIAAELVALFWLLRQSGTSTETVVRNPETGLLQSGANGTSMPQWAFISLLVLLAVIAALAIAGSFLWKKANRLDPARKSETIRYFVQNQLGAIVAIIAFLPLVILIFTNKNLDKNQKTIAGVVAVALGIAAVALGVDFRPPSVEQYTADRSAVIQLLGKDEVFWVDSGSVYHVCRDVPALQTGSPIMAGSTSEAVAAGKIRLTLQFPSELRGCGLKVPDNALAITESLRAIQGGQTETVLPASVWANPSDAPIQIPDAIPGG